MCDLVTPIDLIMNFPMSILIVTDTSSISVPVHTRYSCSNNDHGMSARSISSSSTSREIYHPYPGALSANLAGAESETVLLRWPEIYPTIIIYTINNSDLQIEALTIYIDG